MMIRAKTSIESLRSYFSSLKTVGTKKEIAQILDVSVRTISDWERAKHRIPYSVLTRFYTEYGIQLPSQIELMDTLAERRYSGKLGAIARFNKYGSLATLKGRVKGGQNSVRMQKLRGFGITQSTQYKNPRKTQLLAEFIGIIVGDGHMSSHQIYIYLNKVDDALYIVKVVEYIRKLYGYHPRIFNHQVKKLSEIQISSKSIVDSLVSRGLMVGSKIGNQQIFPQWIVKNRKYYICALRGLFDTDGSILIDRHVYGPNRYSYHNVVYTIFNVALYNQVLELLYSLGFHPTTSTSNRIGIRKSSEVDMFFSIIQPANPKHISRYRFLKLEE